jgi:N-acetylglutamate synthase-like GNAT family acetyltransferase
VSRLSPAAVAWPTTDATLVSACLRPCALFRIPGHYWTARGPQGELLGCVGLTPDEDEEGVLWLTAFSVAKATRRRGVGSALLATALNSRMRPLGMLSAW